MTKELGTLCVATGTLALLLSGCGSTPTESAQSSTPPPSATSPSASPSSSVPVSETAKAVETYVAALDALGIDHSEPVRAEVGLSGAKARYDLTVNGYDAGINVFPDAEIMAKWQKASDSLGGIHVAVGLAVLSLNSKAGISNSAEIAPKIAQQVGGEARGV